MARTKKVKEEDLVVEEVIKTNVDNSKELDEKDKEIEELKAQVAQMMAMLQAQQNTKEESVKETKQVVVQQTINPYDEIELVSYMWGEFVLKNKSKEEVLKFEKDGDVQSITYDTLQEILTPENKKLLQKGLLAFVGDYEDNKTIAKYTKYQALDDEYLIKVLSMEDEERTSTLDKLTVRKTDLNMCTSVFWRSVKLLKNNEISNRYVREVREFLKFYFDIKNLDTCESMIDFANQNGFIC